MLQNIVQGAVHIEWLLVLYIPLFNLGTRTVQQMTYSAP